MQRFIVLISLTLLAFVIVSPVQAQGPSQTGKPDEWQTKVDAQVREAFNTGGETEFFVILTEQANVKGAETLGARREKTEFVFKRLQATASRTQAPVVGALKAEGAQVTQFGLVNAILVKGQVGLIERMAKRADVARIEANPQVKGILGAPAAPAAQSDPAVPWNISSINAPQVWAMGYKGSGVVVGTADTGVQWDHSALKDRYRGWNGSTVNHDYNWFDALETVKSPTPVDGNSHGTHVTGTMVGYRSDNKIGVAPEARWIACRNMDNNGIGTAARYLACMEWLMAPYRQGETFLNNGQPQLGADIQNNSWTCTTAEGCSAQTLATAVSNVRAAGIAFVAAAGNDGAGCQTVMEPPAIYSQTLTVGSHNWLNMLSSFSSRGPVTVDGSNRVKPDFVAPGEGVTSSVPGNTFEGKSGTSMASPHLAGVIALMWSANQALNGQVSNTESLLRGAVTRMDDPTCGPGTNYPNNMWGYGRLNALSAVNAALGSNGGQPTATPTPTPTATPRASTSSPRADFEGDRRTDIGYWRPSTGVWSVLTSSANYATGSALSRTWGTSSDKPVVGDYEGDGRADMGVWRPSTGEWLIVLSSTGFNTGQPLARAWGAATDTPVVGDYDGDKKADLAVWRPKSGGSEWWILLSGTNFNYGQAIMRTWGVGSDRPIVGDFDGDGKADIGVWRSKSGASEWWILRSGTNFSYSQAIMRTWGDSADTPMVGDYDGDGKADIAVWRPSTGGWWILLSSKGFDYGQAIMRAWGQSGDVPQSGDFDGDGKTDLGVFRPNGGQWWVLLSSTNYNYNAPLYVQWGASGDKALAE